MRKAEQRLWDTMKRRAPVNFWLRRIENEAGEGDPDVWSCYPGVECWVELKAPKRPKRRTTRLMGADGLNKAQINWHIAASNYGVRAYTLIRDDKQRLMLIRSTVSVVKTINEMTLEELEEIAIASDWQSIFQELSRP